MENRNYNSNFNVMKVMIEIGALPTLQKKITYWFKLTGEHPQAREEIQLTHLKKNIIGDSKNKSEQELLTPLWILEHYKNFIAKSIIKNLDERVTYCNSNNDKLDVLTEELNIIKYNVSDKRSIYYEGYLGEKRRINSYSFLTEYDEFLNKKFGYSYHDKYMEGRLYYLVEKEIINRLESIKKTVSPTLVNKYKLSKVKKIDLIRVLNALYLLHFVVKESDGQIPDKKEFMFDAGKFFGVDLSKYDVDLSQTYRTENTQLNTEIFSQMIEKTMTAISQSSEKSSKK